MRQPHPEEICPAKSSNSACRFGPWIPTGQTCTELVVRPSGQPRGCTLGRRPWPGSISRSQGVHFTGLSLNRDKRPGSLPAHANPCGTRYTDNTCQLYLQMTSRNPNSSHFTDDQNNEDGNTNILQIITHMHYFIICSILYIQSSLTDLFIHLSLTQSLFSSI